MHYAAPFEQSVPSISQRAVGASHLAARTSNCSEGGDSITAGDSISENRIDGGSARRDFGQRKLNSASRMLDFVSVSAAVAAHCSDIEYLTVCAVIHVFSSFE